MCELVFIADIPAFDLSTVLLFEADCLCELLLWELWRSETIWCRLVTIDQIQNQHPQMIDQAKNQHSEDSNFIDLTKGCYPF